MKAAYLEGNNHPYIIKEVPTPAPADGEVLIRLEYSAFNQRDIRVQKGIYAAAPYRKADWLSDRTDMVKLRKSGGGLTHPGSEKKWLLIRDATGATTRILLVLILK